MLKSSVSSRICATVLTIIIINLVLLQVLVVLSMVVCRALMFFFLSFGNVSVQFVTVTMSMT